MGVWVCFERGCVCFESVCVLVLECLYICVFSKEPLGACGGSGSKPALPFTVQSPSQLLDTAGVDDVGELGGKKKAKSYQALKEVCVCACHVMLSVCPAPVNICSSHPPRMSVLALLVLKSNRPTSITHIQHTCVHML